MAVYDADGNEIVVSETPAPAGIDEEKLAKMIQTQVESSFSNVLEQNRSQQSEQRQPQQQQNADPVAEWLNPHIQPHLQRANLAAAAAMDKADFYSSEEWDNLDEIIDDGEADIKKEKREIRASVEKRFDELVKAGVPTPRKTVLELVLGQKLSKNPSDFIEKAAKKSAKNKAAELAKARNASDIGTNQVASMSSEDVYAMADDDFEKAFADIRF